MLKTIDRISSVSGGSITAALLGLKWSKLSFDPARLKTDFVPEVIQSVLTGSAHEVCLAEIGEERNNKYAKEEQRDLKEPRPRITSARPPDTAFRVENRW